MGGREEERGEEEDEEKEKEEEESSRAFRNIAGRVRSCQEVVEVETSRVGSSGWVGSEGF